ncbi:hypothetical protein [Kutzneria sp. NPDC051319]|uniref:hypothetical protein n=1 Tax=Kutzneria sp. NPDC051319 TaxID=3155047 RepID=UPI0034307587
MAAFEALPTTDGHGLVTHGDGGVDRGDGSVTVGDRVVWVSYPGGGFVRRQVPMSAGW